MPLPSGTRLGPYEVTAPLGAGGMGEVYRAHDSRLNRDVAIKTLPDAFAQDSNRLARFQREAQLLASLSHPNIAAIFGVEESQGTRALVMELVEGPTLAERIAAGPVPLAEALNIAHQIADALEAAHEKGIIHRDLKPANIKLTPDGKVKVLDFGLARALEADPAASNPANSPTLTLESTRAGVILGTAAYMSPEQARGKTVDKRADIWAFGVVLYEMLTGRIAFEGETVSDTLAAVLRADMDWSCLPAGTPPKVRRLLDRCLERDPKRRLRDIGDAWIEMDAPDAAAPPAAPAKPFARFPWLPWIAAALLAAAGILWGWLRTPPAQPRPVVRWTYTQKELFAFLSLSPDGTRMAYSEIAGNGTRLALRMMDQFDARPLPGADGGTISTFSPDGQWIAYLGFQESKLKKIPVTGGTSITLADGVSAFGLSWGDDDTIVFTGPKSLMRVPASGGAAQTLTTPDPKKGEIAHRWPRFLPGAQALLFSIATGDASQVALLDLKKGGYRVLVNNGSDGAYVPTGHLVYVRGGTLFAVPFDLRRLAVTGSEAPVIENLSSLVGGPGVGDYTFSSSGLLAYMAGQQGGNTILAWADRKGVVQPAGEPQPWGTGRLSPDGRFVANELLVASRGGGDIWTYEVERKILTRLTFEGTNQDPIWTPDGRRVTFSSAVSNKHGIAWVPADGSGKPEFLLVTDSSPTPNSWSPDGKFLVYSQPGPNKNSQLWLLSAPGTGGDGKPRLLHDAPFGEFSAQVSPDGKWIAYVSTESGGPEVYLQPFPAPGAKLRVSTQGGLAPRWSPNGRELFYWTGQGTAELMRVDIQTTPALRAGIAESLFRRAHGTTWDVGPGAQRFLIEEVPDAEEGGRRLEAVVNWFDELRRRAPIK